MRRAHLILAILALMPLCSPAPSLGAQPPEVGQAAPALALPDLKGGRQRLEDYRGRLVLVNFWGTWCPPCLEELPALERLHQAMDGRPFTILAVDVNQPGPDVAIYAESLKLTLPVLLDEYSRAAKDWRIKVYPTTFLVDADGVMRRKELGPVDWDSPDIRERIEALMPERKP